MGTVGEPINEEAWHWYDENIGKKNARSLIHGGKQKPELSYFKLGWCNTGKTFCATLPLPGVQPVLVDENGKEVTEKDEQVF